MSMQTLSGEQVAILGTLWEIEKYVSFDEELEFETNEEKVGHLMDERGWELEEIELIVEELQYWGYVDKEWNVTILGRQYLKTGPDCGANINITNDFSKNYDLTLFERLAELSGVKIEGVANFSIVENLTNLFAKFKK